MQIGIHHGAHRHQGTGADGTQGLSSEFSSQSLRRREVLTAWWKWPIRFALVAALTVALAIVIEVVLVFTLPFGPFYDGPLDYALKYLQFLTLSKEHLIRQAEVYIRDVAGGDQIACLYVVACDGEHARLELVSDIVGWDLRAAKYRIWRRRFSNYCPGRTTSFGLHLIPRADPAGRKEIDRTSHARWSFLEDGFTPQWTHFQGGGSFTDQPWEQCTPERAIVR